MSTAPRPPLDRLTDAQLQLLLRAAGYTPEEIAAMDRASMIDTLEHEDLGATPASRLGNDDLPVDEQAEEALLRHLGYSEDEIASMDDDEREEALGEVDPDMVTEALLREGYTQSEIDGMSDEEKMALIDPNDVLMHEALEAAGYSDDEIAAMSLEEKADALDMQTAMEDAMLRGAGYDPDDLDPAERAERIDDIANNPDQFTVLGDAMYDTEPERPDANDPMDVDVDPEEEDPDDPEDDELGEDDAVTDAGYAEDEESIEPEDAGFTEGTGGGSMVLDNTRVVDEQSSEETLDEDGFTPTTVLREHGGQPGNEWTGTETTSLEIGPDGYHSGGTNTTEGNGWSIEDTMTTSIDRDGLSRRHETTQVQEDATGISAVTTAEEVSVGPDGAGLETEFHEVSINVDGSVQTTDRTRSAEVGADGASYERTREQVIDQADGSSTVEGDRTEVGVGPDGLDLGLGRTDVHRDADGSWTGTDADFDLTLDASGLSLDDTLDTRATGGPLGDRGVTREVDLDVDVLGVDLHDAGSVTVGGQTLEGSLDVDLGVGGLELDVTVGDHSLGLDLPPLAPPTAGLTLQPMFTMAELEPVVVTFPDGPDLPSPDEVVDVVVDVVDDVVDDLPAPPPPPEDVVDEVGDALGGLFD